MAKALPSARQKTLSKEPFADKFFAVYPLLSVALGKPFAECISGKASDSSSVSRGDVRHTRACKRMSRREL